MTGTTNPWLDILMEFESADEVREFLRQQYLMFDMEAMPKVAVIGTSGEGERFIKICQELGIEIAGIYEANTSRVGKWVGEDIVHLLESIEALDRSTPVVIASHRLLGPMDRLRYLGFENVAPLAAIQVLNTQVFPPHFLYDGMIDDLFNNRSRYVDLMEMLGDDISRKTLDKLLGFRLTLDVGEIRPCIDWNVYFPDGMFEFSEDEVYVDCGAYEGDSINFFIKRVNNRYTRVVGFEPDPKTHAILKQNFVHNIQVEIIDKGVHDHSGVLSFDDAGSRTSILAAQGGVKVPVTTIDDVFNGDRVTYIKMNIEGAELEALRGAKETITCWKPRLAISGYHRPTDLWQIPLLIKELNPEYRLYLRQHDGGAIETVCYGL